MLKPTTISSSWTDWPGGRGGGVDSLKVVNRGKKRKNNVKNLVMVNVGSFYERSVGRCIHTTNMESGMAMFVLFTWKETTWF